MPCEVLRQCSATNPADIIIYVPSMTVLGLKSHFIFHARIDTAVCTPMCIFNILTPYEYYMVLPALAINAASKGLPHQLCTLHFYLTV